MTLGLFALILISVSLNALAQIALRKLMIGIGSPPAGAAEIAWYVFSIGIDRWFISGMACYVISIGLWLLVLARVQVSLAYPMLSIGYLVTASIGYFYLNEQIGMMRLAGLLLICVGILVISRS